MLHTHTRRLDYHPHVHLIMPAAAIDATKRRWRTKAGYLFNHQALAKVFRAKMLAGIEAAGVALPARYPNSAKAKPKRSAPFWPRSSIVTNKGSTPLLIPR